MASSEAAGVERCGSPWPKASIGPAERQLRIKMSDEAVGDELLEGWLEMESSAMERARLGPGETYGRQRSMTVSLMLNMKTVTHMPLLCWFQAMRVFDASTACLRPQAAGETVLARAAAAWLLCRKFTGGPGPPDVDFHLQLAAQFATELSLQHNGSTVSEAAVLAQERQLLLEYAAALRLPTVRDWLSALLHRFNAASCGAGRQALRGVAQWASQLEVSSVVHAAPSADSAPHHWAVGIFCAMLMAAHLLPVESVCPPGLDGHCWTSMVQSALASTGFQPQMVKSRQSASEAVVAAFEFATGLLIQQAQSSAMLVVRFLCDRAAVHCI